jgi:hypothetical protein
MYAQWAAAGSSFITLSATSTHVVRGDLKETIQLFGTCYAHYLQSSISRLHPREATKSNYKEK